LSKGLDATREEKRRDKKRREEIVRCRFVPQWFLDGNPIVWSSLLHHRHVHGLEHPLVASPVNGISAVLSLKQP
jgi:hypothetical protein